ncbi:hypothetical protein ACIQVO_38590 [Streptomyces sp. NPDC101062]|uniref:hypothetical protein n=1 Tax=unclassified Streptomyces TaxID=2593676 RepID=UPI003813EFC4
MITTVLEHWRQRGDREDLYRAAHRQAALLFLTRYRSQMDRRRQALERARIAVAETGQRIAVLQDALNGNDQTSPHIRGTLPMTSTASSPNDAAIEAIAASPTTDTTPVSFSVCLSVPSHGT